MHRWPVYIYLFNVPSFSSRHFNKIKQTSRLGRLLALSLEILFCLLFEWSLKTDFTVYQKRKFFHADVSSAASVLCLLDALRPSQQFSVMLGCFPVFLG